LRHHICNDKLDKEAPDDGVDEFLGKEQMEQI
jgi:hypothetical protein